MLKPFANESDSLGIGEITVENRMDRVEIYGSLNITRDKAGLDLARHMKQLIDSIVESLERSSDLPQHITETKPTARKNPFA